jgi:macrolide-specific efflux system membrane fusion protein
MNNRKILFLVLPVILILLGLSYFIWQKQNKNVVHPQKGNVIESVYGIGIIRAHQKFHAHIALTAVLQKLMVKEGQNVQKGTSLFQTSQGNIVRSPIAGLVTNIFFNEGEIVFPQADILVIQNLKDRYIEVSLEQQGAIKVRPNQQANISFEGLGSEVVSGNVTAILPQDDKFIVHVTSPELSSHLLPGMSVDVTFNISEKKDAILVPINAVNNNQITIKREGKKKKFFVKTGLKDGDQIEIISPALFDSDIIDVGM